MTDKKSQLRRLIEIGEHPLREVSRIRHESRADTFRLGFHARTGELVRGYFMLPKQSAPCPVVLVIHAHGNRYNIGCDELLDGRPALQGPIGPALAELGIASLCLDMPCFGERAHESESSAAKRALWLGKSLAGQMTGECAAAIDWLQTQPEIDPQRIGVFGISMGATLGYWLAAVDERVQVLAHECCFADFAPLIETGGHDLHGIYLTVPGLLNVASNGEIAAIVAPRPQFIAIGDTDPLTPAVAADPALATVRAAYANAGGRLEIHREPDSSHVETPAMRTAVLAFLASELS